MPIYIGDYLGDTQRLTTEQHGAYLLMIFDYWRGGPLPDDDEVLQQVTRLDRARWKKHKPVLSRLFVVKDGQWFHKRIELERVNALENQERRSGKARAAAEARWSASGNAEGVPDAMLGASPVGCPPPSPSPSPTKSKALVKNIAAKPGDVNEQVWGDFLKLRAAKRAPLTETALKAIRSEADKIGWSMDDALTECVVRGWQGFKADWIKGQSNGAGHRNDEPGSGNTYVHAALERKAERTSGRS